MGKPRIAFVISSLGSGGAERVVTTLANELSENYEVHIITFVNSTPFYNLNPNIKPLPCYDENKPSKNLIDAIFNNYLLLKKIIHILKEHKIELLIGFMTTANILATITGKIRNIPVIISERTNPYKQQIPKLWKILRILIYPFANNVVVQNETIKDFFKHKINQNHLLIIPNPIANELTQKRDFNTTLENEHILLSVGRLSDIKAQDIIIKAFAKSNNTKWKLIIAGEGPERGNLEQLITSLNLRDKVLLPGRIKEISRLYNSAKIFAFSSTYEGFPNALIEAMHFGLACVSTDCPTGPSELIQNGKNGYLVPVNDVDEFAKKLNCLMESDDQRRIFGEKARDRVQILEAENISKRWQSLIASRL